jgi:hypothetical protein
MQGVGECILQIGWEFFQISSIYFLEGIRVSNQVSNYGIFVAIYWEACILL